MNNSKLVFLFALSIIPILGFSQSVIIKVSGIEKSEGMLNIGLYRTAQEFLIQDKAVTQKIVPIRNENGEMKVEISDLSEGKYALAIMQDVNGNGKMDYNFLGVPIEPYGFSNNPNTRYRKPLFRECEFSISGNNTANVEIKL